MDLPAPGGPIITGTARSEVSCDHIIARLICRFPIACRVPILEVLCSQLQYLTANLMKSGIHISQVWFDDDLSVLQIGVSDGTHYFSNQVYAGHAEFADTVSSLNVFKEHIHGGLLDIRFGELGPEHWKGAFHARFRFLSPGRLYVSCEQESEFFEFGRKEVAGRATIHIQSEPALLDRFIAELQAIATGTREKAYLEAI